MTERVYHAGKYMNQKAVLVLLLAAGLLIQAVSLTLWGSHKEKITEDLYNRTYKICEEKAFEEVKSRMRTVDSSEGDNEKEQVVDQSLFEEYRKGIDSCMAGSRKTDESR